MRVLLALVVCLSLLGCSGAGAPAGPTYDAGRAPAATPPADEPTASTTGPPVTLTDLTAVEVRGARERLEEEGLAVRTEAVRQCRLLRRVVVDQSPGPRSRVAPGTEVVLTVGRPPAAAACARRPAPPLTRAFLAWASRTADPPAFAPRVRLLQGNRQVAVLTAARARDRDAWTLPAGYAELSALDLLDWMDDQVLLQPSRGLTASCLVRAAPLPDDLVDRLWWSSALLTASADACLQVAAVQVWVDDRSRIAAVGFLSGSP